MEQPLNIILDLLLSTYLAIIYFSEVIFSWLEGFGRVEISQLINNWGNLSFTDSIILSWAIFLAFLSSFAGWVSFICFLSLFGVFAITAALGDHRTNATNDTERSRLRGRHLANETRRASGQEGGRVEVGGSEKFGESEDRKKRRSEDRKKGRKEEGSTRRPGGSADF